MKMIKKLALISQCVIMFCCCEQPAAHREQIESATGVKNDSQWVSERIADCYATAHLASLVQDKQSSQEIKQLAVSIALQQDTLMNGLKSYAAQKEISIPAIERQRDKATIEKMVAEDPKTFDKAWCKKMLSWYQETVQTYERAAVNETTGTALTNWINKTLPSIRSTLNKLIVSEKSLR